MADEEFRAAVEADVAHVASISPTPREFLVGESGTERLVPSDDFNVVPSRDELTRAQQRLANRVEVYHFDVAESAWVSPAQARVMAKNGWLTADAIHELEWHPLPAEMVAELARANAPVVRTKPPRRQITQVVEVPADESAPTPTNTEE